MRLTTSTSISVSRQWRMHSPRHGVFRKSLHTQGCRKLLLLLFSNLASMSAYRKPNRSCPRHYNANQELTICLNTQFQVNTQPFLHGNNPELEGEVVTCPKTVRNAGSSIVVKHITVESRITNS